MSGLNDRHRGRKVWLLRALAGVLAGAGWLAWPRPAPDRDAMPVDRTGASPAPDPTRHAAAAPEPALAPAPAATPAQAASDPAPPQGSGVRVGSEGYGAHVQRALDSGRADQALDAAQWIADCRSNADVEAMLLGSHPKGYRLHLPEAQHREVIEAARRKQQHCLTVTPDLLAQHKALAERALDAKLPGAAKAYADALGPDATAAERERAVQALREAVRVGDPMAVLVLLNPDFGLPRVELQSYRLLVERLGQLGQLPALPLGAAWGTPFTPPLTPAEQAEAEARLQGLLPAFRRKKGAPAPA